MATDNFRLRPKTCHARFIKRVLSISDIAEHHSDSISEIRMGKMSVICFCSPLPVAQLQWQHLPARLKCQLAYRRERYVRSFHISSAFGRQRFSRRTLSSPEEFGRARVSQTDLLQQSRQGRTLRCLGAAETLLRRGSRRLQITSRCELRISACAPCARSLSLSLKLICQST